MSDYKSAMKRLRTLAPNICETVANHTAQLRAELDKAKSVKREAPPPPITTTTVIRDESEIKRLQRQLSRMQRRLDEARQSSALRDSVELHRRILTAAVQHIQALDENGRMNVSFQSIVPLVVYSEATELADVAGISVEKAARTLIRMAFEQSTQTSLLRAVADIIAFVKSNKEQS